jgi:hypothetical protein
LFSSPWDTNNKRVSPSARVPYLHVNRAFKYLNTFLILPALGFAPITANVIEMSMYALNYLHKTLTYLQTRTLNMHVSSHSLCISISAVSIACERSSPLPSPSPGDPRSQATVSLALHQVYPDRKRTCKALNFSQFPAAIPRVHIIAASFTVLCMVNII